jgi:hypothetical protein
VIGQAYVELLPKLDKFNRQLKAEVDAAFGKVDTRVNQSGTNVGTSFRKSSESVKTVLGGVEQTARRVGVTTTRAFTDAGTKASTSFKGASAAVKRVEADTRESTGRIKGHFKSAGQEITNSFGKMAAGAAAGAAVFQFFKGSFSAASDLNETVSKTRTVFGPAAASVETFAATADRALGQSKKQAEDAISTFGNLFQGLKIGPQVAADMSIQLDKLASDFASFHNADPSDVIESITAAFRGEYDSVQRFVPTLQAATVQQEALRETGLKSTSQLTQQQLAFATFTLLTKGAGAALGDFSRTSSGAANQQRILRAEFENLQARIGNAVIPVMLKVFQATNAIIGGTTSLISNLSGVGTVVTGVFHGIGNVLETLGHHKTTLIGIGTALAAFIVISKGLTLVSQLFTYISTAVQSMYARTVAAAAGMRTLSVSMTVAQARAFGLNAIIGLAAIGIGIWAQKHAEAKARVQEHKDAVGTLADALRASNGVVDDNVRAMVAQQLEQKGLLEIAQHLGIATGTYTNAVLGNKSAVDQVNAAIVAYVGTKNDDVFTTEKNSAALVNQLGLYDAATAANQRVTTATQGTTTATGGQTTATKTAAQALADERAKIDAVRAALENLANVNLDAQSTHLQFQAAVLALDVSLKGLSSTERSQTLALNGNTVAGNSARQTLISNVKAAVADYDAQIKRGVGISRATATLQADLGALRAHYHQLGFNDAAVNQIISSLGVFGQQHPTATVNVNVTKARSVLATIQHDLKNLRDHTVHITGRYVTDLSQWHPPLNAPALAGLQAAGGYISGPGKRGIDSLLIGAAPGEFMVNADAVSRPGVRQFLERLNRSNDFTSTLRTIGSSPTGQLGGLVNTRPTSPTSSVAGSGSITIAPGAVQLTVHAGGGSWDNHTREEIEEMIGRAFADLLRKIQTGGVRR